MDEPGNRLRILHVVFSLGAGGMENGIVNIAAALPPSRFDIHIACLARGGEFLQRFPFPDNVRILGKKDGFSPGAVTALARHLRRLSPRIIHTHNLGPLIYTALAAPLPTPILHGEHAQLTPSELAPHRLLLRRILYRRAARIHTVSESLRQSLILHQLPAARLATIVNGVDTTRFHPASRDQARRDTRLPLDSILIGLVGRFGPFKRHADLIRVFEQLAPLHPRLALLFTGAGGPLEEPTRRLAAASPFASRIHFAGLQLDPRPWYQALDLLVIPSVNEGLSNALLEAMACGIPALGHTACGNQDVIRDSINGYLRDIASQPLLYAALTDILASARALPALGAAARDTVCNHFSFGQMLDGYASAYRLIAGLTS